MNKIVQLNGTDLKIFIFAIQDCFSRSLYSKRLLKKWLRNKQVFAYLADGRIASFVVCFQKKYGLYIALLGTVPNQRKHGYAQSLLKYILEKFKPSMSILHTQASNMVAKKLYEKFNFEPVALKRFYYFPRCPFSALKMERKLLK